MKSRASTRTTKAASRPASRPAPKRASPAAARRKKSAPAPPPLRRAEVKRVHIPLPKSPLVAPSSPSLALYGKAMASLQKGDFEAALKKFEHVTASSEAEPVLADRARVYVDFCRRKADEERGHKKIEDLYTSAVFEKNRGELDASLDLIRRSLKKGDDEKVHHLAASIHALRGNETDALEHLKRALKKNPALIFQVRNDPDFVSIKESIGYRKLEEVARKTS